MYLGESEALELSHGNRQDDRSMAEKYASGVRPEIPNVLGPGTSRQQGLGDGDRTRTGEIRIVGRQ